MRILVTGTAGFIGSHVAGRLCSLGHEVIGIDNMDPYYPRTIKKRNLDEVRHPYTKGPFIFREMDIMGNLDHLVDDFGRFDAIVHLAAKAGVRPSIEDPVGYQIANVVGTTNVLEFARRNDIEDFIFASSSSVYGESAQFGTKCEEYSYSMTNFPVSPYAASKRSCEMICATYAMLHKLSIRSLRFFTVYGPRQRPEMAIHKFLRKALKGEKISLYGDPDITKRDYTYIDDIVNGVIAAIEKPHESGTHSIYNLGGGSPTTLAQLMRAIEDKTEAKLNLCVAERQPGDVLCTISDIQRATRDLGYEPKVSIEDGIDRFLFWIKEMKRKGKYVEDQLEY